MSNLNIMPRPKQEPEEKERKYKKPELVVNNTGEQRETGRPQIFANLQAEFSIGPNNLCKVVASEDGELQINEKGEIAIARDEGKSFRDKEGNIIENEYMRYVSPSELPASVILIQGESVIFQTEEGDIESRVVLGAALSQGEVSVLEGEVPDDKTAETSIINIESVLAKAKSPEDALEKIDDIKRKKQKEVMAEINKSLITLKNLNTTRYERFKNQYQKLIKNQNESTLMRLTALKDLINGAVDRYKKEKNENVDLENIRQEISGQKETPAQKIARLNQKIKALIQKIDLNNPQRSKIMGRYNETNSKHMNNPTEWTKEIEVLIKEIEDS